MTSRGVERRTRSLALMQAALLCAITLLAAPDARAAKAKPAPRQGNTWQEARLLADQGHYDDALTLLRPVIAADTADIELRWLQAGITGEAGRHAEAVGLYERLCAAFPDRAGELRSDLASQRLEAGDSRGAARDFRVWLVLHADDRAARTSLALALARSDSLKQSLALYDSLRIDHADDDDLACARARVLGWMGRHDDAIAAYRAVLARAPGYSDAQLGLAVNENWSGRHRQATRQLESMPKGPGADPEVTKTLALARYWDDDPDGALRALERYRQQVPDDSEAVQLARRIAREQRTTITLGFGREDDSDGLHVASPEAEIDWPLATRTTGSVGWRNDLTKDAVDQSSVMRTWAGVRHRFSPAWTGYARGAHFTWDSRVGTRLGGEAGLVNRPLDHVRLEVVTAREPVMTRIAHENGISLLQWIGAADWMLMPRWSLHGDARAGYYSDGNRSERTGAVLTHETWSSHRTDLSLLVSVEQLNTHQDLDHGYYDPDFHREWGPGAVLEWRADSRWTLGGTTKVGWQRDKGGSAESYYGLAGRVRLEPGSDWTIELEAGSGDSNLQTDGGYRRKWWHLSVSEAF